MFRTVDLDLAHIADAERIAALSRTLIETGLDWRWTPARVAQRIRDPDAVVLAARAEQELIGFAIMGFLQEEAHLLLLAVNPAYQRRGIGRQLMNWLEQTALTAGIARIVLEVRADNRGPQVFYRTLGFANDRVLPRYYSGIENALRMVRRLR